MSTNKNEPKSNKPSVPEKEVKKAPRPQYYTVSVEAQATISLSYRILAESPQAALEQVTKSGTLTPSQPPTIRYNTLRKISGKVYDHGSSLLRYAKQWI